MDIFNNIIKNRTLSEQGRNIKLRHNKANFLNYVKMIYGHLVEYGFDNITFNIRGVNTDYIHGILSFDEDNDCYVDVILCDKIKLKFKFCVNETYEIFDSYNQETLVKFLDEYYTDYEEDDEFLSWVGNENIKYINSIFK